MSTAILATKLYILPLRPKVVSRPRLIERLNEGLPRKLTLISAPAGFGKTTLVSEWLATCARPAAWLSLDEGDNDLTRFLTYFVTALQTIVPAIGEGMLAVLQSSQPAGIPLGPESMLTALLNEITTIADDFVLVLDDYHVIDATPVNHALTFLLEYLPPQMHLVITTRDDPQLALARYRARGQLTEMRATDLRFSLAEAVQFLDQVMGLSLSAAESATLETRTEGWIAGLQLAALSMQGHQDVTKFIQEFAGDHRYIVDYLVEEVLQRQPEPVRSFLLQTAILDRLSGPLCDAVTGQAEGKARLDALERGNFFVVPLDDKRHWYRYHHLFAEVLSAYLREEQPDHVPILHRRACEWYEQNGQRADAIRHALAAEDFERAGALIELAVPEMRRSRQEAALLGWLKALPDELVRARPVLSVHYAAALLSGGELEGVEARLRDAERWLDMTAGRRAQEAPSPHPDLSRGAAREGSHPPETGPESFDDAQDELRRRMVVVDEEEFRRLPGSIAIYCAGYALARGDVAGTITYAWRALDLMPEQEHLGRGSAAGLLGLAFWASGDLEAAHRTYAEGMASLQRAGHIADAINGAIALADIRIAQGRLHEAMRTYEQALQLATEQGTPVPRGVADMYVGMSELYRERDNLNTATQYLLQSKEQGAHPGMPQNRYRWRVAMARIREAEGDLDGALDLLHEAERLYVSDLSPSVRPVTALKTRVWVAQGRLGEALDWVREQGLSTHDDLSYLREFEHITLARILLERYKSDRAGHSLFEAMGLLARLLRAAEAGGRTGRVIEILALQALAHDVQGNISAALIPLQQALMLAEPQGYVRIFVDEGPPMAQLLEQAAKHGIAPNYVRQLLTAFGKAEDSTPVNQVLLAQRTHSAIEPLSERELEVLKLLATELNGPEIAHRLMVSLSTMRTHTNNIYSKLEVNNRRAATRRAEELNLL
jgi:LuxR family transcriptional regulator, maltose regulon positive regulatory protein